MKIINYLFYIIFIILLIIIIKDLCYSKSKKCYYEFYDDNVPSNPSICNAKYTCSADKKCVPDQKGTYNDYDSCNTNCKVADKVSPNLNENKNKNNNVLTSSQSSKEILYQKPYNDTICADPSSLSEKEKKRASGPRAGIFIIKNGDKKVKPVKYYNISKHNDLYKLVQENPQALQDYMNSVNEINELNKKRTKQILPISQYIYMPKK
tara:strand:+ start:338 stop:961 length:624 start_codon:yes stop_codon:yes gene_type:complete